MHRIGYALALAAVVVAGGAARASDPVGAYMIVDRVILSPSEEPSTIQIWGTFVFATRRGGNEHGAPQRGYLYFEAPRGKEAVCRKEWKDLKKLAGTGEVVAFGTSYDLKAQGKLRAHDQKVEKPDRYPLGNGLVKVEGNRDYEPVRNLVTLPRPRTPGDGDLVAAGEITLVVGNITHPNLTGAKYSFELVGENGDKEKATVEAGKRETKWTPRMKVVAGKKYTWRVRATEGKWEGPVASSVFVVKGKK